FVRISGTGTARDQDGKPYTLYFVEVRCLGARPPAWTVYRRYKAFQALHEELRAHGCRRVPPLPPKRFINVLDLTFVAQRRVDLESWLYQLVDDAGADPAGVDPRACAGFCRFLLAGANDAPFPMEVTGDMRDLDDWNGPVGPPSGGFRGRYDGGGNGGRNGQGGNGGGNGNSLLPAVRPISGVERPKVGLEDFELIRVVGKGSFGKVTLVRKKSSGRYYAMKVLTKAHLMRSKQVEHTRTERRVLG
ncbi:unnamed protein product, partial [Phaeothamnion confervicola]